MSRVDDVLEQFKHRARVVTPRELYLAPGDARDLVEMCHTSDLTVSSLEGGYFDGEYLTPDLEWIYGYSIRGPEKTWDEVRTSCYRGAMDFLSRGPDKKDFVLVTFVLAEDEWVAWRKSEEMS
jgi:hypothetical protein